MKKKSLEAGIKYYTVNNSFFDTFYINIGKKDSIPLGWNMNA